MLGSILDNSARIILGLSDEDLSTQILPLIILLILGFLGTVVLISAIFIENKKIKIATILFSIVIPIGVEIIDISIRFTYFINELSQANSYLFL